MHRALAVPAPADPARQHGCPQQEGDRDGRCRLTEEATALGPHRLVFATGPWFTEQGRETFWPEVVLTFAVREPAEHHHVPLLLSPFAYSTYRGS